MTIHLGDVPASSTLYIPFATYDSSDGSSITMTGLAATDIEIYKNGSATQRSSDAGYALLDTDGIDFDGITGIHGFSIDLSDNTDAGFFSVGGFYWVVVSSVTVDSLTVNFIAATFRIVAAEAIAGKPKVDVDGWLGTAAATPTVAGVPEVDLTHVAGATTNVAALATNVDAILTDTADMQPKLGTPAGASISADILVIDNFVDGLETTIGAAGAGLTAVPWNAAWDAEVQSEVDDALVAQNLDHLVKIAVDTNFATTVHLDSVIGHLADAGTTATFDRTTDSAEALQAAIDTIDNLLDTEIPAITAAVITNAAGADIAADIIAIKAETAAILDDTDDIGAAGAGLTALATQASVNTIDDLLDTELPALTTEVGKIPKSDGTSSWNATALAAIQGEANDALVAYDPPTNAELTTAQGVITALLPAALTGDGNMKVDVLAISGDTTAADRLEALMDGIIVAQVNDAGASTTSFVADGFTEATNDHFNGRLITFLTGALAGQQTAITDYVGATQTLTVTALTEAPAENDFFIVH